MALKQLTEEGTFEKARSFGFVSARAIKEYLGRNHEGMLFTVGLSYRNPTTHNKPLDYEQAIETLDKYSGWFLEALHDGNQLSVTALSDNDLW